MSNASSQLQSPSLAHSTQANTSPASHQSPRTQSAWKSVFRFPNSSSKKLSVPPSPSLFESPLITPSTHGSVSQTPLASTASLAPASYLTNSDQRSSYNSSSTQSSESNLSQAVRGGSYNTPPTAYTPHYSQPKSTDGLSTATPPRSRQHTKSERARPNNPRLQQSTVLRLPPSLNADASQLTFPQTPPAPQRSRTNGPLSPKSVGATASRFIRRVASAPNAKGLFSMGSRSGATTKNGLLAPADIVPPLPPLVSSSSDQGQESSLETVSSGSSRGRMSRLLAPPMTAPLNNVASQHGLPQVPSKIAFRRTYSSNSIKVRQVRHSTQSSDFYTTFYTPYFPSGGSGAIKFCKDQDARQGGRGEGVSCTGEENEQALRNER